LYDVLKTGITPNVDIRSQGELTLVDRVWISAALIFLALMCFWIVLLAHGANQSVTTQTQAGLRAPTPSASLQPLSKSNQEAHAQGATIMTQRESYYVALLNSYWKPEYSRFLQRLNLCSEKRRNGGFAPI
jgi:hypothetical protein